MNHETEEITYERTVEDRWVNNYNWHILSMCQSTMDMQLNLGTRTLGYISKYITKADSLLKAAIQEDNIGCGQGKRRKCRLCNSEKKNPSAAMSYMISFVLHSVFIPATLIA